MPEQSLDTLLNEIRALGEETRLRIVFALGRSELTVSELTYILEQSQPRVSRHVKILADAEILERHREGAWVFYRLNREAGVINSLADTLAAMSAAQAGVIADDAVRLREVHAARADAADAFFQENADSWERLRRLHTPDSDIEETMRRMVGSEPVDRFLDLGTGTGRMLIVFRDLYREGIGYDTSRAMLAVARAQLEEEGVTGAQVRQGDLFDISETAPVADLICIHQVLHYLSDPPMALKAARRLLRPGGRILIADFASHNLEFLREDFAHRRLGFSDREVASWASANGLGVSLTETLTPAAEETDRLTVKLWLLTDQSVPARASTNRKEVLNV